MPLPAPYRRSGEDFDTLLGHSFGTSKRQYAKKNFDEIDAAGFNDFSKRNFDEIDNAGFKDYLSKRNFDEIDNAGFKDYLGKRNFDEIDAAGFNDFSKRTYSNDANAINAPNDKLAGDGGDAKDKRNFDEIDAAGFNDFSKRKENFDRGFDACQCKNDDMDRIKALLLAMKQKIHDDLAPYYDEHKNRKFGNKDEKYNNFLSYLLGSTNGHGHYNPAFGKYGHYYPANKRGDYGDYSPYYRGNNFGKYDMHPYYSSHFTPFHPFYFPVILDKNYVPPSFSGFLPTIIKYYKQKYGQNMGHYAPSKYPAAHKPYYRGADYDQHTTYPKTNH